jgi:hypothetical protein
MINEPVKSKKKILEKNQEITVNYDKFLESNLS